MNIVLLSEIITYLVPATLLVGVCIGIFRYRSLSPAFRLMVIYLFISLFADIMSRVLAEYFGNNLIMIPLFGFAELLLFSLLYFNRMLHKRRPILFFSVVVALVYILGESIALGSAEILDFQSYARPIEALLIIVLGATFTAESMKSPKEIDPSLISLNTINIWFFALNLVFFLPLNFLITVQSEVKFYFWLANCIITLFYYLLLVRLLWKNGKTHPQLRFGS